MWRQAFHQEVFWLGLANGIALTVLAAVLYFLFAIIICPATVVKW